MADLRQFRRAVSILKRKGLIGPRTSSGQPLDARAAQPGWKTSTGQKLSTVVNKYDAVVSGKADTVKVTPKQLRKIRKIQKYETANNRVIVPVDTVHRAKLDSETGLIKTVSKAGIERIQLDIPFENLEQYLKEIARDSRRINRMKRRSEYFGFRFFGNNSSELHRDIRHAIEQLQSYSAIANASTRKKQTEIYKNLEIVRVTRPQEWLFPSERRTESTRQYRMKQQRRFRRNLKRKPVAVRRAYAAANAARVKAWRDRLKKNKRAYKSYLKDNAKRAIKSKKAKKLAKKNRRSRPRN